MTAKSELFVNETVRDSLPKLALNKLKNKDWEIEVPNNWRGLWNDADFPAIGIANILVDNKIVGKVKWKTKFGIGEEYGERYIEASPSHIKVIFKKK